MSVADVQVAGPFSRFDGIERWFAVLEGDGLVLSSDFASHHLTPDSEPFRFDGSMHLHCAPVRGSTRDFNLMTLPGRARMERVKRGGQVRGAGGALLALYTHGTEARLHCAGEAIEVPPYHLAWHIASGPLQAGVEGEDALWMEALT
jgi:environmental stress-induced protein Ves